MIRSYYFQLQLADVIKEELKHNFCWVSVELEPRYAYMMGKGKGWGKDGSDGEDKDSPAIIEKVVSIITVRNSRDALGEKGARIRLLQHKVNSYFGFSDSFLELFIERKEREYDSDDSDGQLFRKGKGRGKGKRKGKGYNEEEVEEEAEEPSIPKKAKPPKPKMPIRRYEVPQDFGPEQWMECAKRCAQLSKLLKEKKPFGPVQMLLGDPLRYGLRLWREYNLRAAPRRDPVVPDPKPWAPVDTSEFADWGVPVPDDWGAPCAADWGDLPTDPPAASISLTEEEKLAARAKRFGASTAEKVTSSLLLKDFGSDEDVHLNNLDLSSASCADVIEKLKEVRCFPSNVEPVLVLLPSGKELEPDFQMSKIPAGESLKFMALTRKNW